MASDRFLSLGFHVGDVSSRFAWPLADFVLDSSDRVAKSFSGNCQALPAILAWQLYVFCHTVRREVPQVGRFCFQDAEPEDTEPEDEDAS